VRSQTNPPRPGDPGKVAISCSRQFAVIESDSTSLYLDFRALGRPFLWAAYFSPIVHA
jgi:hypothetical protein